MEILTYIVQTVRVPCSVLTLRVQRTSLVRPASVEKMERKKLFWLKFTFVIFRSFRYASAQGSLILQAHDCCALSARSVAAGSVFDNIFFIQASGHCHPKGVPTSTGESPLEIAGWVYPSFVLIKTAGKIKWLKMIEKTSKNLPRREDSVQLQGNRMPLHSHT